MLRKGCWGLRMRDGEGGGEREGEEEAGEAHAG
jgi:hypothetical protein